MVSPAKTLTAASGFGSGRRLPWPLAAGRTVAPADGDPLTQTFIQQASVAYLDTSCLATVPVPPFDVTLQGVALGG